jgi:alginate O-acetyltransferase complex protein AlgI
MIFTTPWFLLFSVAVATLYVLVRRWRPARLVLMLAASIFFYIHFVGLAGFGVMGALAAFTYAAGLGIHRYAQNKERQPAFLLVLCLSPAVLALLYFRYYDFLDSSLSQGLDLLGAGLPATAQDWIKQATPIIRPLGISFFAFEFCHYLVDVHNGEKPIRNPLHFGIFALFYPRLVSGPIVRFQQIVPQLSELQPVTQADVSYGLLRISIGFAKKFVLADPAAQLVSTAFQPSNILVGTDVLWLCLLLYIRIYMDFGGYCDMAIGLARLWGIRLPENFRFPFLAASPSAFWRRWHITLSTWIRDYIYIPLGGGRMSAGRKGANLLFAMALCGLWHGSAWNFVLWGVLHGVALQIGHGLSWVCDWGAARGPDNMVVRRASRLVATGLGWALTQLFVGFTWILFFFSAEDTWQILGKLRQWP